MAITLTTQSHLLPSSGLIADGEGVHSLLPFDMVRSLNNLGTFVCPFAQYAQSCAPSSSANPNGEILSSVSTTAERFLMQMPIAVPEGAVRMYWHAGITIYAASSWTLSSVKVYLSRHPYTGSFASAFSTNNLPADYQSSADTSTSTGSTNAYHLRGPATGLTPIDITKIVRGTSNGQPPWISNLILTATCNLAAATVGIKDFTCWFRWE